MEDKELVENILSGNFSLYKEIMKRYWGMVFANLYRYVRREDAAEEFTQQAFIRAYARLDTWQGATLGSWITSIAIYLAVNEMNKERRQKTQPIESIPIADKNDYSEEREQLLQAVEARIEELPSGDKAIIKLHYYEGRKAEEIARQLGMTTGNVLVKLHRIREKIKKGIENERTER